MNILRFIFILLSQKDDIKSVDCYIGFKLQLYLKSVKLLFANSKLDNNHENRIVLHQCPFLSGKRIG